ncbi:uncharacterized protein LOC107260772 isoform X1 [Ricinus communis]|uniref:uncharacterized protein LOC107260772 isoform X1 n=1 Tax=Ricinus communis TaxID=3988 RepID=UPI00201A996F|nr:uncharacterized protein LOC107260772 isoform X1 [Ricinus communis]XP_015570696.2 uncharacterized protein LOC107260772 isoform X1 [Ricinus communis]
MECEVANSNNKNPFPSTAISPPHSSLPISAPISPLRRPKDEYFRCRKLGHWANECPNKSSKKSAQSSPSSSNKKSIKHGSISPMVRCLCGRGFCLILISKTEKNPGRMFDTCPGDQKLGKCGFFKWYDQFSCITTRTPMCPCGAGICRVNKSNDPNGELWYFAANLASWYQILELYINLISRWYQK